jgi:hypothetical protein
VNLDVPAEYRYTQAAQKLTQLRIDKLDKLDKLAAGGYITPEEYKKKKQAVIDSM